MAPYHMAQAATTRVSTHAQVGIGAGVSARVGSNVSPRRLENAFTRMGTRPRIVSSPDSPTTSIPGPFRTLNAISDRKSTRLNSSHGYISYAVFCLKKKNTDDWFIVFD